MFSIFTIMANNWYVYTLSHKGNTFYVGITRNLIKRYKCHCTYPYENTHNYIHWIKEAGELPGIHILNCFLTQREAEGAETSLIRHFIHIGNKLCNVDINPPYNRIITCNPYPLLNKKKRLKRKYANDIIRKALETSYSIQYFYGSKFNPYAYGK